ncbi:hypothetical protein HYR54_14340 [Candidatus Acetothermia bacterium]|nr:hypothetical protein [Candidatus Acetothermia bacterium]
MADSGKIRVTIYRFTGKQGFFTIPERYCEECDLTIAVTRDVLQELNESRFELVIKPWFLYFWEPLWRGGWHAPIVTINGRIFSQGVVPKKDEIKTALAAAQRALEIISV